MRWAVILTIRISNCAKMDVFSIPNVRYCQMAVAYYYCFPRQPSHSANHGRHDQQKSPPHSVAPIERRRQVTRRPSPPAGGLAMRHWATEGGRAIGVDLVPVWAYSGIGQWMAHFLASGGMPSNSI